MKKLIKRRVLPFLKRFPLVYITAEFFIRIIFFDFRRYAKLKYKLGPDSYLIFNVPHVTGDTFIFCMWCEQWAKRRGVSNYVIILEGRALPSVVKLFPKLSGHWYSADFGFPYGFVKIGQFSGNVGMHFEVLNTQVYNGSIYLYTSPDEKQLTPSWLLGYKGFSIVDYYFHHLFNLPLDTPPASPVFDYDESAISAIFKQTNAVRGKTVLLAPYSTGNSKNEAPPQLWSRIAADLISKGYDVFTNCADKEEAILGTRALFVPYRLIVPFLEVAGGLVAFRSGFCDLISSARCKKVIIHSDDAVFWPRGNSIAYTGLVHMGLCDDAVEMVYEGDDEEIVTKVIESFK